MASTKPALGATEEHEGPRRSSVRRARDVLVVAFPEPRALPVPIAGEPVGREWFEASRIADSRVSTQHIVFTRPGGRLFVQDVGSRNGTWANGARLAKGERVALSDGDILRVGRTLLVYREDFIGGDAPSQPVGQLVGPYGLRGATEALTSIASRRPTNVLIEGETGTGKELVARALADATGRGGKYGIVNVAGIAPGVFESQLFGYVAGAYSGSGKGSPGMFLAYDGGAVFLDEIGELPLELQAKLLRVLDNREVLPVGAVRASKVDVLVISATNLALEDAVEKGAFRRDLLARLSAARVDLPPLRERVEDIWEIARVLAESKGERLDARVAEVEAVERLMLHPWTSNVRELASALERIAAIEGPPALRLETVERVLGVRETGAESSRRGLTAEEVQKALARCGGNESAAARQLGISRGKLRRLVQAGG